MESPWIGRINIIKMAMQSKAIYRFNAILIKRPMSFFAETEESILTFIWKNKRPQKTKVILSKNSNPGGITVSDFKLCYRAIVTKTVWYLHKNR
jgi:hypothetical protein